MTYTVNIWISPLGAYLIFEVGGGGLFEGGLIKILEFQPKNEKQNEYFSQLIISYYFL